MPISQAEPFKPLGRKALHGPFPPQAASHFFTQFFGDQVLPTKESLKLRCALCSPDPQPCIVHCRRAYLGKKFRRYRATSTDAPAPRLCPVTTSLHPRQSLCTLAPGTYIKDRHTMRKSPVWVCITVCHVVQNWTENVIWYLLVGPLFGERIGRATDMQRMRTLVLG